MKFSDLDEGNIFNYEGADYMKFKNDSGSLCFMVKGFLINNHPENITKDSEVKKLADSLLQFEESQK